MAIERRLAKELAQLREVIGVTVEVIDEEERVWGVKQRGACGTPYADGVFEWEIRFPNDYPFKPPLGLLKTEIYHVNLTLATRQRPMSAWLPEDPGWGPATTIAQLFDAIRTLMIEPYAIDDRCRKQETQRTECPNITTEMFVSVKTLTGKVIHVQCGASDNVLALKGAVQNIEGVPIDHQRMIFAGKELENKIPLADYGITPEKKIMVHLVLRLGKPKSLEEMIHDELAVLYSSDRKGFDDKATRWAQAINHTKLVTLHFPEAQGGTTMVCRSVNGDELYASSAALGDLYVKDVRTALTETLDLPSIGGVALVLENGILLPMSLDSETLAEAIFLSEVADE